MLLPNLSGCSSSGNYFTPSLVGGTLLFPKLGGWHLVIPPSLVGGTLLFRLVSTAEKMGGTLLDPAEKMGGTLLEFCGKDGWHLVGICGR